MSMHKIPLTELERDGLKAHGLDIGTPSQLSDCFRHGVKWALDNSVPKWIPVSERLPDSDDEVLVYPFPDNSYGIRLGTYHPYEGKLKGKWTYEEERHSYYEQVEINNVTHWMPLPAAPVGDK